jgi:nucleoside-diphosphate kinase
MKYSFVMLKPDALERALCVPILERLKAAGVEIEMADCRRVDTKLLFAHYEEAIARMGGDAARQFADYFTNRWVMPMVVKGESETLIEDIRKVVGATNPAAAEKGTIRGDFGIDSYEKCGIEDRACENLIHASDSPESVRREIGLWFGQAYTEKYAQ